MLKKLRIRTPPQEAFAKNAEYGLLEGKAAALIHPVSMVALYVFTLFTGYLGLQWRKLREIGDALKPLNGESKALQSKADALKAQEQPTSAIDAQLKEVAAASFPPSFTSCAGTEAHCTAPVALRCHRHGRTAPFSTAPRRLRGRIATGRRVPPRAARVVGG